MEKVKFCEVCRSMNSAKHGHFVVKVRKPGVGYGFYNSTGNIVSDIDKATKFNESKAFTIVREAFENVSGVNAEVSAV